MSLDPQTALSYYLETSVWGALAPRQPAEMKRDTERMLLTLPLRAVFVSSVVFEEVRRASSPARRRIAQAIGRVRPLRLTINRDCDQLAQDYLDAGVLPAKKREDALHVAVATYHEMDFLVSWNYRHLANARKITLYQEVNRQHGYAKTPMILTPYQVLHGQDT